MAASALDHDHETELYQLADEAGVLEACLSRGSSETPACTESNRPPFNQPSNISGG